nr:SMI1/KNR4 family protein [Anaerocolumna cellulosilytica]
MTGAFFTGGVAEELIEKLSEDLEVELPKSYKEFLRKFGEGGLSGTYTFGIENEDYSSAKEKTKKFRKELNISNKHIVVAKIRTEDEEYILCLDTANLSNGECPVIKYDMLNKNETKIQNNFADYFNSVTEREYQEELSYQNDKQ